MEPLSVDTSTPPMPLPTSVAVPLTVTVPFGTTAAGVGEVITVVGPAEASDVPATTWWRMSMTPFGPASGTTA